MQAIRRDFAGAVIPLTRHHGVSFLELVQNLYHFAFESLASIFLFALRSSSYGYTPSSQSKIHLTIPIKIRII